MVTRSPSLQWWAPAVAVQGAEAARADVEVGEPGDGRGVDAVDLLEGGPGDGGLGDASPQHRGDARLRGDGPRQRRVEHPVLLARLHVEVGLAAAVDRHV